MDEPKSPLPRREFLGGLAAAATAIGLGGIEPGAVHAADAPAATQFQAWLDGIPGRYRQLYDAPAVNGGFALIWSHVFLVTAAQGYGVPESELGVVVVLRHGAIPIAFRDAAWEKYKLGEMYKVDDPATRAPALRNPFAHVKPGDLPLPEAALEKLVERGVRVAVCNAAIHYRSMRVAQQLGVPHETVRQDWLAAVLPGVQVVPSGVLAVNGAQAKGCSYCFAG
ncbi:MAG TPA: twin-arginine translocation signal domain-containing protein [Burkholderiales bacterium]|nr:twin-arginine translocation signal domain-containing protein [Burkholderiales bacterium]